MTAAELLARAKSRTTQPPARQGRTRASYKIYVPAITEYAEQGWRPVRIKEAIAEDAQLDNTAANRLYDFICRQLRPRKPRKPRS